MSAYISVELRQQIRDRFGNCCAYCHTAEFLTAMTFELEHIHPLSQGGKTVFENLCLSCPFCNRHKGSRTVATDPESGKVVSLFHPQKQIWSQHFAWSPDGTEIIGLTEVGRAAIATLQMNRPALVRAREMWVELGEHPPVTDDY